MKADDPNLKAHYRMPRVFGALPGPRNVPKDKQQLPNNQTNIVIAVTALTDARLLGEILPPDCTIAGDPTLTVTMTFMSNIGWLAGRGYAILNVGFRIAHESKTRGTLTGMFTPVLWENLADPIITGREELGFAKIYADMPPPVVIGDTYTAIATWQGFRFFDIAVFDLEEAPTQLPPARGAFHYKFIPRTGAQGEADAAYLEYAPPRELATGYGGLRVTRRMVGTGQYKFHAARWEDVPFHYPIINALAALPIHEIREASVTYLAASGMIGDPSGGALTEIG